MAYTNDQQGPFWDFVRGMDHHGAGVDRAGGPFNRGTQPGRPAGPHPPPPPPFGTGFPFIASHSEGQRDMDVKDQASLARGAGVEDATIVRTPVARDQDRAQGRRMVGTSTSTPAVKARRETITLILTLTLIPTAHEATDTVVVAMDCAEKEGQDLDTTGPNAEQHPSWAHILRSYAPQARSAGERPGPRSGETGPGPAPADEDAPEDTFTPPIDVFSTEAAYVLHIALPGAKKEDVGVNWDADKGELNIAGVVYRPGDETFLKSLKSGERRVGAFERSVKLPPRGKEEEEEEEGAEVDGEEIGAKLEDGLLVITVPKVEREWIEVKKVDIN
ncbi:uncharacterized protein L3040_006431 [Drepanopeziza brunnea f. sp. 'multigermtubi']|uniref:uncharacterized protein n=1 Tax=Drepanopeziza brunnea f. sp. 'multigermtubi' TaxID=698441 RepID=UPI00239A95BB|nr:hypothetical protein L3040_006431 [Drepanopeziza brunnea f. sp. 'multigermtubi']